MEFRRAELYIADLPVEKDSNIQGNKRPILVISCDDNNKHSNLVDIVPLTGELKKLYIPTHVVVENEILYRPSMVLCEQIRKINKELLWSYIDKKNGCLGRLSEQEMIKVDMGIMFHYGISIPAVNFYSNVKKNKENRRLCCA